MTDPQLEDEATWSARLDQMRAVLQQTREDLISHHLACYIKEGEREWADRIYARLRSMPLDDLTLAVVLALYDDTAERAKSLWSAMCTARAEDASDAA